MSFDFFNSSNVAWGNKLSAAFRTLEDLKETAFDNLDRVIQDLEYYSQFINRNYSCPRPTSAEKPCRSNEIFTLIEGIVFIKTMKFDGTNFEVELTKYNSSSSKITVASGTTTITEGYCFVKQASSLNSPYKDIRFSKTSTEETGETTLFQYRIDTDSNKVYLVGDISELQVTPYDCTQYRSMAKGDTISLPYTADGYEAVCVVDNYGGDSAINLNGTKIYGNGGGLCKNHVFFYLKDGDVVSGSNIKTAFKIEYND